MKGYFLFLIPALFLTACTISFQNIDSLNIGGEQTDTVEDEQSPQNDIKPDLNMNLPIKPL